MCLFSVVYQTIPDCPVFVLANREEDPTRPTAPPRLVREPSGTTWLGGIDLRAGGTWLGVNDCGLLVAITNRPRRALAAETRSRGLLCRDLLGCATVEAALDEIEAQRCRHRFAGFNVALVTKDRAVIVESGDDSRIVPLAPGIHTVTNGAPNDPGDPRLQRAQRELKAVVQRESETAALVRQAERICALDGRDGPPICLESPNRCTVCSTVLALSDDPALSYYRFAPGPPSRTPYHDHSILLQGLLTDGASNR